MLTDTIAVAVMVVAVGAAASGCEGHFLTADLRCAVVRSIDTGMYLAAGCFGLLFACA